MINQQKDSIFNYESVNESVKRNQESPEKSHDSIIMSGRHSNRQNQQKHDNGQILHKLRLDSNNDKNIKKRVVTNETFFNTVQLSIDTEDNVKKDNRLKDPQQINYKQINIKHLYKKSKFDSQLGLDSFHNNDLNKKNISKSPKNKRKILSPNKQSWTNVNKFDKKSYLNKFQLVFSNEKSEQKTINQDKKTQIPDNQINKLTHDQNFNSNKIYSKLPEEKFEYEKFNLNFKMFKKTQPNAVSELKLKYMKKPIQKNIEIEEESRKKDLQIKKNIMNKIKFIKGYIDQTSENSFLYNKTFK